MVGWKHPCKDKGLALLKNYKNKQFMILNLVSWKQNPT